MPCGRWLRTDYFVNKFFVRTLLLVLLQFAGLIGFIVALIVLLNVATLLGGFGLFLLWIGFIILLVLYLVALPAKVYDGSLVQGLLFALICMAFNAAVGFGQKKMMEGHLTEERAEKIVRLTEAYRVGEIKPDMDYGASSEERVEAMFEETPPAPATSPATTEAELKARYAELLTQYENLDHDDSEAAQRYQQNYQEYEQDLKAFQESAGRP